MEDMRMAAVAETKSMLSDAEVIVAEMIDKIESNYPGCVSADAALNATTAVLNSLVVAFMAQQNVMAVQGLSSSVERIAR